MSDATLPGVRAALVDPGGTTSRPFYAFFQSQATNLVALSDRVSVIESTPSSASNLSPNANVIGAYSIAVQGTLRTGIVRVLLEGDVEFAGATNYYGSDSTGAKGWYAISDALADSANIIKSVDTGGVTSFDLSDVTVGSGGTLQKYGFDAKGRLNNQSAATTSDLAEGSNLYFTAARVLSTVLAGLSTASSSVITAADSVLSSFGKLQAQITDNLLPAAYIDGLKMVWVSGTALTVTTGSAYIPSLSKVLRASSDIVKTGLSLSASTWYHVYLYDNAGTPDIEIVTTAPSTAYSGTARSKTGDTSRRYAGSVLADASGNIFPFVHSDRTVMYDVNAAGTAPFRVLTNGAATTATSVSVAGCAPLTAWQVVAKVDNEATNAVLGVGRNGSGGSPFQGSIGTQSRGQWLIALNGSTFGYVYNIAPTPLGGYIDVIGYGFNR